MWNNAAQEFGGYREEVFMFTRLMVVSAILLAAVAGAGAQSILDYRTVGPGEVVAEAVRDISGDDAEARRAASERLISMIKAEAASLGVDPKAEGAFLSFSQGMLELVAAGKATSRVRAERLMEEAFGSLADNLRSSDKAKSEAALRVLASFSALFEKNLDSPSAEKFAADIKDLFASASVDAAAVAAAQSKVAAPAPAEEKPAPQATAEKPAEASPEAKPEVAPAARPEEVASAQAEPAPSVAVAPPTAAAPEAPPATAKDGHTAEAAEAKPAPVPETITVKAPPPPPPRPRTGDFPLSPVVVSSSPLYADNPAYKVTTVVAPPRSRPGYREEQARAEEKVRRRLSFLSEEDPGESLINLILDQLRSPDAKRIDSGLKLTSRVSEVIIQAKTRGVESNASLVMAKTRELLSFPEDRVKRSAALAATALKDRLAVRPLIDLLKAEEESTASTARAALYSIVGVDLGAQQRPWLDWAAANQTR